MNSLIPLDASRRTRTLRAASAACALPAIAVTYPIHQPAVLDLAVRLNSVEADAEGK